MLAASIILNFSPQRLSSSEWIYELRKVKKWGNETPAGLFKDNRYLKYINSNVTIRTVGWDSILRANNV